MPSRGPGGPDRRIRERSPRASRRGAGRSVPRAANCFHPRFPVGRDGPSATASPCCTEPRRRSRNCARKRLPWPSSPLPRHAAGDVPPQSSGATRGSDRSAFVLAEPLFDLRARRARCGLRGCPWSGCSSPAPEPIPPCPRATTHRPACPPPRPRAGASSSRRCRGWGHGPGAAVQAPPRGRSHPERPSQQRARTSRAAA